MNNVPLGCRHLKKLTQLNTANTSKVICSDRPCYIHQQRPVMSSYVIGNSRAVCKDQIEYLSIKKHEVIIKHEEFFIDNIPIIIMYNIGMNTLKHAMQNAGIQNMLVN